MRIALEIAPQHSTQYADMAATLAEPELRASPAGASVEDVEPARLGGRDYLLATLAPGTDLDALGPVVSRLGATSAVHEMFDELGPRDDQRLLVLAEGDTRETDTLLRTVPSGARVHAIAGDLPTGSCTQARRGRSSPGPLRHGDPCSSRAARSRSRGTRRGSRATRSSRRSKRRAPARARRRPLRTARASRRPRDQAARRRGRGA